MNFQREDIKHILSRCGEAFDAIVEASGQAVAWLVVLLVVITAYDVAMRYVFERGSVAIQELEWHLFAAIFLLAGGYTLRHDGHVRVDMLYRSRLLSDRARRVVDALGAVFILLPFSVLVIWSSLPFVSDAFIHNEVSPDPGGLGSRWAVKALIPLGFGLICLQGLAQLLRAIAAFGRRD